VLDQEPGEAPLTQPSGRRLGRVALQERQRDFGGDVGEDRLGAGPRGVQARLELVVGGDPMAHQLVTGPDDGPQGSGLVAEGLQDPQPVGPQAQVLGDQLGVTGVRLGPRQDLAVSPRLDRVRLHRGDGVARLQQRVDEPAIGPFDRHGHAHRCAQLGQPLGEPFNAISTVGHRERADLDAARIE
jgi:hypothetical protein